MQKQVEKKKYYVVRERAVPEVLLKVVEAKRLLESKRVATVQEAAERTGISPPAPRTARRTCQRSSAVVWISGI